MVPCRMPIWLAGVVAGSLGRHSTVLVRAAADPARERRQRAGADAPVEHRVGHAVGLHEDDARDVGVVQRDALAPRPAQQRGGDRVVGAGGARPRRRASRRTATIQEASSAQPRSAASSRPSGRRRRARPRAPGRAGRAGCCRPSRAGPRPRPAAPGAPRRSPRPGPRSGARPPRPLRSKPGSSHDAITRPSVAPTSPSSARPRSPQRRCHRGRARGRSDHVATVAESAPCSGPLRVTRRRVRAPWEAAVVDDAEIVPGDRPGTFVLRMSGMDQSYVDLDDPTRIVFDYVRRLADVVDAVAPRRRAAAGGARRRRGDDAAAVRRGDPPALGPGGARAGRRGHRAGPARAPAAAQQRHQGARRRRPAGHRGAARRVRRPRRGRRLRRRAGAGRRW